MMKSKVDNYSYKPTKVVALLSKLQRQLSLNCTVLFRNSGPYETNRGFQTWKTTPYTSNGEEGVWLLPFRKRQPVDVEFRPKICIKNSNVILNLVYAP